MNEGDEPVNGDAEVPSDEGSPAPRDRGRRPSKSSGQASGGDDWDGDDWDDDDWDDDDRGGSGLDLRLVGAIVAAVVIVVLVVLFTRDSADDTNKDEKATPNGQTQPGDDDDDKGGFCGNWPASFGGDGSNATVTDGIHLWSDFDGIHLRSNLDEPVTVKLSGNSDFSVTTPGSAAKLSAKEGKEVTAEFEASDGSDGPDFDMPCFVTVLNVEVTGADGPIDATQINLGGSSVATENPYKLVRDPA